MEKSKFSNITQFQKYKVVKYCVSLDATFSKTRKIFINKKNILKFDYISDILITIVTRRLCSMPNSHVINYYLLLSSERSKI